MSAVTEMHLPEGDVQIFSDRFGTKNRRFYYDLNGIRVLAKNPETLLLWYFALRKTTMENEQYE